MTTQIHFHIGHRAKPLFPPVTTLPAKISIIALSRFRQFRRQRRGETEQLVNGEGECCSIHFEDSTKYSLSVLLNKTLIA